MDEIKDILKAIINGQHALRNELLTEIAKLQKNMEARFKKVDERFEAVDKRFDSVDARLDKLGTQLAFLEDDTPTREEHNKLEKRIGELELKHLKH